MIDFCIEKNIQPVLTIIPVTKELSKHFPNKFVQEQIIDYINKANDKKVRFLNYWKDMKLTTMFMLPLQNIMKPPAYFALSGQKKGV